jgi:SAM-dependent methyltransferase
VTGTALPPVTGTALPPVTGTALPAVTGTALPPVIVTGAGAPAHQDRPPRHPLQEFYENPQTPVSSGPDRAQRMARMLARALRDYGTSAVVLDVGCGDGAATSVAARRNAGHRMVGLDWSADALRHARRLGLTLVQAGVEPPGLPVAAETADVVIMSELIEHLIDTDSALDEARRVLKRGGSLLLSTPNLAAWYNRGLLALGVQPVFSEVSLRGVYGRPGSQVAGHLRMFTRRALVQLLAARGFDCVRVSGACYHDVPGPLRPLDRAFCAWPSAASILLVHARKR